MVFFFYVYLGSDGKISSKLYLIALDILVAYLKFTPVIPYHFSSIKKKFISDALSILCVYGYKKILVCLQILSLCQVNLSHSDDVCMYNRNRLN